MKEKVFALGGIAVTGLMLYALFRKRNLLENGGFELGDPPIGWDGWSNGTGYSFSRDNTEFKGGSYSLKIVSPVEAGSVSAMIQNVIEYRRYAGMKATLGCWALASEPDAGRIIIWSTGGENGVFHPGNNLWRWLTVSLTIPSEPTDLSARVAAYRTTRQSVVRFDDAFLFV